ncbi:MAG: class I SAM-dependent methyltransferase [Verrucomicrobiae bacterium]|nr:class I SAM-dependent methyltransferase [Verrucomicrobiae bacterium]
MHPCFARFQNLAEFPHRAHAVDQALIDFHQNKTSSVIKGRNVIAGYVRGWGLQFNIIRSFVQQDPIYIESLKLVEGIHLTHEVSLMNIFLIMKYGLPASCGDIIEFGSYRGGSAIFIANVAKKLGITGTVYALDTFTGLPAADPTLDFLTSNDFKNASFESLSERISKLGLTNLIPIKGPFQETTSNLLKYSQKILLSYLDCKTYESTHYALSTVLPHMHAQGGYLLLHDPIHSNGLGPLQAMEEMIEAHQLYAEQAYPHMVYRYPKL